ncbi:hypothetical protein DEJ50_27530 [Streptomyces venezuelae]|uniref:Uncharacterized protein n=1 Tax=Streptomyces venezuelae TaxID=54571 RepID=A0A5P2D7C3_STRVZ|nr:hypothetical protein [Streptomyces venezuelae]QES51024.1 hypothetical protein DEJ50_27530 [Streptomyces venezuelae]
MTTLSATGAGTASGTPRVPRPRLLLAGALLLTGLSLAGWTAAGRLWGGDGGLMALVVAREYQVPSLWLVLASLAGALALGVRSGSVRGAGYVGLSLVTLPVLVLAELTSSAPESVRVAAPGRDDRHLLVHRTESGPDPVWLVYVRQGDWPLERRWLVGSFHGDEAYDGLAAAVWDGPGRVRLDTSGGETYLVGVAPSGRPDRRITVP